MCFVADLRKYVQKPEDARALYLAAVLASRIEGGTPRPEFTGMVMLHAAQYFADRLAEAAGLEPWQSFLGLMGHCGIDDYDTDLQLTRPVLSLDSEAARFFEQNLKCEAVELLNTDAMPAWLAAGCVAVARTMFAEFAVQAGVGVSRGDSICAAAATLRMLSYEIIH